MAETHAATILALYEAFSRRDDSTCLKFFHSNAEWTSAENFLYADQSPYTGKEAIRRLIFDRLLGDWDEFSVSASEIIGDGELVIANGRFKGKFKANGAFIDAQFVQVFHFQDGRIAKCHMYTDTAPFKEATERSDLPEAIASAT